jgi:hypothetical protein
MLMHRLSALLIGAVLLGVLIGLAGCGGGGNAAASSSSTSLTFNVYWPASTAREIPSATQGLYIDVKPDITFTATNRWLARPAGATSSTVTFLGLPPVHAAITVTAYDSGTSYLTRGNVVATGSASVTLASGQATTATVYLVPIGIAAYKVAFVRPVNNVPHIFKMNAGGGTATDMTPTATQACIQPALSYNGKTLAYVSDGSIKLLDMGTNVATSLYVNTTLEKSSPAWSPTDNRLAFIGKSKSSAATVYVTNVQQNATTSVTGYSGVPKRVIWSDANNLLVVTSSATEDTIYQVSLTALAPRATTATVVATDTLNSITALSRNPSTGSVVYLANGVLKGDWLSPQITNATGVTWLPDGSRLALCWGPAGSPSYHLLRAGEVPVQKDAGRATDITVSPVSDGDNTAVDLVID